MAKLLSSRAPTLTFIHVKATHLGFKRPSPARVNRNGGGGDLGKEEAAVPSPALAAGTRGPSPTPALPMRMWTLAEATLLP